MKKLIKKTDAAKIYKANNFDRVSISEFCECVERFNKKGEAQEFFTNLELNAIAIYFATKAVEQYGMSGVSFQAYKVFREVDQKFLLPCGTTYLAIKSQAKEDKPWIVSNLTLGESIIFITEHNPYHHKTLTNQP